MGKIFAFLLFLLFTPSFSYAEIHGTVDSFKTSQFFTKYKFSSDAKPYTLNKRSFVNFYQKETLDKINIEFDPDSNRIIKQIGYLKERAQMDQFVVDFISEATGGIIERSDLEDILTKFQQKYSSDPLPLGDIFQALGSKQISKYNIKIERSIIMEYIVEIEAIEQYQEREQAKEEFEQKLHKGDAESYILKGLMAEQERNMDPSWEAYKSSLKNSIPLYEKAIELSPGDADANLLLAKASISAEEYPKAIQALEAYLNLKPDDKYAHYYLGKAYNERGNYQKAEEILKK